jgi:cation diffusion facilitator CzcD-associated flavoprotein CzcO
MIYAIGGFMSPLIPADLGDSSKFRGVTWHSARWRHDVDLKGKRIGVIGNGCSA